MLATGKDYEIWNFSYPEIRKTIGESRSVQRNVLHGYPHRLNPGRQGSAQVEITNKSMEVIWMQAEELCGLGEIAPGLFERLED